MNSMTGFGKAEIQKKNYRLQVELTSVNSRFLEIVFRMPRTFAGVETLLKEQINRKLSRGKVTVAVVLEESPAMAAQSMIDPEAARSFYQHLKKIKKDLSLPGEIELQHVIGCPQLFTNGEKGVDSKQLQTDIPKAVGHALNDLLKMRIAEGKNLKQDLSKRLKTVSRLVNVIAGQSTQNVHAYKLRLEKRIKEIGNGLQLDSQRLAEEVTIFADRCDLTEECIRLKSHIKMFSKTIKGNGDAGKKLNFILQEMGRESNTISSKSLNSTTSTCAIEMKEEIEKLREQVQNIE